MRELLQRPQPDATIRKTALAFVLYHFYSLFNILLYTKMIL